MQVLFATADTAEPWALLLLPFPLPCAPAVLPMARARTRARADVTILFTIFPELYAPVLSPAYIGSLVLSSNRIDLNPVQVKRLRTASSGTLPSRKSDYPEARASSSAGEADAASSLSTVCCGTPPSGGGPIDSASWFAVCSALIATTSAPISIVMEKK